MLTVTNHNQGKNGLAVKVDKLSFSLKAKWMKLSGLIWICLHPSAGGSSSNCPIYLVFISVINSFAKRCQPYFCILTR